jgi:hypothetical protein
VVARKISEDKNGYTNIRIDGVNKRYHKWLYERDVLCRPLHTGVERVVHRDGNLKNNNTENLKLQVQHPKGYHDIETVLAYARHLISVYGPISRTEIKPVELVLKDMPPAPQDIT